MGTNYYVINKEKKYHIGKQSCGWKFLFEARKSVRSIDDMKHFIGSNPIIDEYANVYGKKAFFDMVTKTNANTDLLDHTIEATKSGYEGYFTDRKGFNFANHEFC